MVDRSFLCTEGPDCPVLLLTGNVVCTLFAVSLARHADHFAQQQQRQRVFVSEVEGRLCGSAADAARRSGAPPSEAAFQDALHAALRPMQVQTARHVHGAFWFKSACSSAAIQHGYAATGVDNEQSICNPPVLMHEKCAAPPPPSR